VRLTIEQAKFAVAHAITAQDLIEQNYPVGWPGGARPSHRGAEPLLFKNEKHYPPGCSMCQQSGVSVAYRVVAGLPGVVGCFAAIYGSFINRPHEWPILLRAFPVSASFCRSYTFVPLTPLHDPACSAAAMERIGEVQTTDTHMLGRCEWALDSFCAQAVAEIPKVPQSFSSDTPPTVL
jgi:hypothetical protein